MNPVPWIIVVVASRIMFALLSGAAPTDTAIPSCSGFADIVTGCSGAIGAIGSFVFGTLPGIAPEINLFLAIIGAAIDVWVIVALVRGVSN